MRLQDDIDFTTLTWVKGELDETLKQARLALEAFVEDPEDASQMRFCATYLHQVQGTLRMVELYGAAMVTEEMEHLASALQNRQVNALDEAYAVLMRGIVQLPDYLERLQSGHKDIPIVLLPLLNDLRAARGEKGLSESALFAPDLSQPLPATAAGPSSPRPELELRQMAANARSQFQIALLRWFKGLEADTNLARMIDVCDQLVASVAQEEGRRLFWVAGSLLFGVRSGEIEASQQLKQTVGRVEREIKHLAEAGDTGFRVDPPRELTRSLLYFIAHGRSNSDRLGEVRSTFRLDMFVPTAAEFEDARRSISGHNRALLDTVAGAIREDLLRVKDALDLFLRKPNAQASELAGQVDVLDRVGDTLGMLGLGVPRRVVMEQRDVVALVSQGQRAADESTLLDIAGALLYVDATLDDQVQQLGSVPSAAASATDTLPRGEARKVLEAVIKEAQSNFAQVKHCYVAFVESNWDHAQLNDVQRLLEEVTGAMRILDLPESASLLQGVAKFTAVELVQHRRVPNGQQMDTLADALASLEYFIEALREQRGDRGKILEVARDRLAALGYWPVPEHALVAAAAVDTDISKTAPAAPHAAKPEPSIGFDLPQSSEFVIDQDIPERPEADDLASLGAVEVAPGNSLEDLIVGESASEPVPPREVHELEGFKPVETEATRPPAAISPPLGDEIVGFQIGAEDIDEEIREVFVEEVQEEIDNLRQLLPVWRSNPDDTDTLKSIRRVFHTLKGSGRLVGALVLGEFAWKIENMLNRVLDSSIPARPQVQALVAEARDVLPKLLAALRGEFGLHADLAGLKAAADALAAGQIVDYLPNGAGQAQADPAATEIAPTLPEAASSAVDDEDLTLTEEGNAALDSLWAANASSYSDSAAEPQHVPENSEHSAEPVADAARASDTAKPSAETANDTSDEMPGQTLDADLGLESMDALNAELEALAEASDEIAAADESEAFTELEFDGQTIELESIAFDAPDTTPAGDLVLVDADLFEILKAEVAGHLDTVEAYLQRSASQPQVVDEALLRAVHTINGAFAMTEVDVGTEIAWPLEGYIKRLLAQSAAPSPHGFEVIDEATQAMRALMIELDQPLPRPQRNVRLAARVSALRDALPEPTTPVFSTEIDEIELLPAAAHESDRAAPAASADEFALLDPGAHAAADAPSMDAAPADAVSAKRTAEAESADSIESDLAAIDFDEATASGELSFESEFVAAEPFDPEASAQSADLEIIETESKSTSPYWTDTESAPVLPTVDTGLTLDEIGESEAADAWLAAFEAEVAGEPARAPATTVDSDSEAPVVQGIQVESLAADDPSVQQDALLIASILAGGDTAETAPPAGAVSDQDAAAEHASGAVEGTASEGAQSETEAEPLATSDDLADAEDLLPRPLAVAEAGDEDIEVIELSEFNSAAEADAAPRESTELQEAGFEQDGFPADSSASDTPTSPAEESPEDTDDALQMLEEPRAGEADHEPKDETSIAALADSETLDAERAATVEPSKTPDAAPVSRLDIAPDLDPEGPLDLTDVDADLLDVFLEEGIDILDHSDSLLGRLRDAPQDQEMVVGLQRDLHTLKGGARMAGLHPIGDLAHVTESLLEAVAAGGRDLGPAGVEVLERAFDRLHGLVSRVGERQAIAMPVNLLACVEALLRGESLPTIADRSAAESAEVPSEPSVETVPIRPALPPIRFVPTETAMDEEGTVTRAPQEQIRIRADLLDRLVNYAGEVAIYRARLEQQLGAFRGNLGELDQTTTRLREQLRKLEIETEAQILSRYQRQQDEGDAKFDPLELDRFSTLQQLSRALSESASDIVNLQSNLEDLTRQYETLLLQQSRVSSDLQEGLMRTRMVPFDSLVPRLRRILRQTSGELGKEAQLKVEGSQGEMDRNVLDRMTAPLEHMLRNALAHGLETPEDRIDAGKATEGTIRIQVAREASEVLIRVSDDGRGLDREAIKRKAIERGLMKPDAQLGDRDLYGFILESGFSTAASVSKIAGRGVGMDVVYSEIRQLGGSLHIESERGRGTEFIIRLPFTLAVTQAVFVKQGETAYAVPITSVQGVSRIDRAELDAQLASGSPSFNYAGEDYAIHDLGLLLGQPAARASESLQVPVLLARSGDQLAAICVDAVLGSREIVVKPTGPQVSSIPGIFGATIMGDGRVVVILDVAPLVRRAAAIEYVETPQDIEDARPVPLVMVVDDSITMRKVTGRVLERHNFEVLTAKDGLDAIEKLAERVPDVMLLDIEMPRMDGYELATHMRNDARLRSVPIIMITSRTGDKHRQRAFEIGVDRYLGKPYQEADLMRNVMEILQVQRERSR